MILRLKGMNCFGETNWNAGSGSDEIYAVMTLSTYEPPVPGQESQPTTRTSRSDLFEDVDAGGSYPNSKILYIGDLRDMALSVTCMEHDNADPDDITDKARSAAEKAAALADAAGYSVPDWAPGVFAEVFTALIGGGDDNLGQDTETLTVNYLASLIGRPLIQEQDIAYHFYTFHNGDGSTYKFYFDVV